MMYNSSVYKTEPVCVKMEHIYSMLLFSLLQI